MGGAVSGMVTRLRNWAFAVVFYGLSVPLVLGAGVAALFSTRLLRRYTHRWIGFHRWCARALLGIDFRVEGTLPTAPVLIAAKHQSLYETFQFAALLDGPAIVMKQELSRIPVWGWAARRYGMIVVDRAGAARAMRALIAAGEQARAEERSVVIFPEGTRVAPGDRAPLQPGFAGLYRALALPVVPVALDSGRVWPRHGWKRPGIIIFRFGEPIPPGLPRREIETRVYEAINALEG